ncbi:receptor-like protein EIX2 [Lactuca sativa]|uniref:Leucine-rich repeat-containing N-terminal plant-type domain-containing protein n=1 Tax=Lactuca sativa TaxID=4236 RepID=A0A9R1VD37_LACSA|nr:receptor-like protein EIX2 [Lactuca sativa]KAJ0202508.1 hypothetical protein LSAT_V11C500239740 [Lactuca sativa]
MHLLLYFLLLFICSNLNYAETRCVERDRRALLEFKKGLTDDYALLKSWRNNNASRDCCKWRGVGCNNNTDQVIKLDLPAVWSDELEQLLSLSGEIDSSLLSLNSLTYLDLSGNSFTRIPNFLGSLNSLQHLKLANIELTSSNFPHQLGNLSSLQTLDLLATPVVMKNTDWLSRLSSLKYLNLSYIDLSESVGLLNNAIRLPSLVELHLANCLLPNNTDKSFVRSMTNLSVVDISYNDLPNSMIYPWLFNFSSTLTYIDLSNNKLLGIIPEAFGMFKNLQTLDLTNNGLQGGIPSSFRNMTNIRELVLSGNNLNQDLPSFFDKLSGLGPQRTLQVVDLYDNQFTGNLPDFTTFTSLKELLLGRNQLNGSFPQKFEKISNLFILDLADNRINGFLPNLSVFASLRELYFERNLLNGTLAEKLEPLSKLESLGASSNFFQGTISETHVANLSRLTYLDLSFNSLDLEIGSDWSATFQLETISLSSCKLGSSFPGWLRTQTNFSVLDISNAGINDSVPSWFWESLIPGIRYLNLSSNQIHGMIPDLDFISGNRPLIDMSSNNFSGNLPLFPLDTVTLKLNDNMFSGLISSLCNLTSLSHLDLSNNKLSGELPNCWNNLNNLNILNLENNGFIGKVPDSIGALEFVKMMSLRGNSLIGELPTSLQNCTSLLLLDLGENEISGNIPEWLGESFAMLLVLSLPSNRFNGTIPTSLCKLKNIQILDLSVNDITWKIPKCLNNISGMIMREKGILQASIEYNAIGLDQSRLIITARVVFKALLQWKGRQSEYQKTLGLVVSLDLSSNRLTGEIPSEITSLSALIALNLSRNSLIGSIPKDIGRLRQLDFLDLSRNDLLGGIPTSLSELSNLGVLDLSFNNLSGRIPKGTQLQSFDVSSYAGNLALCGVPLKNVCPGDETNSGNPDGVTEQKSDDDDKIINKGFIFGIVAGFAFGFWGFYGSLVLKESWRHAYYGFLNVVKDWVLLRVELTLARLRRRTSS